MKAGRRWLAFDADFMFNPLTKDIRAEFGADGVVVWVAFLCACKRSATPGQIRYSSEAQLLQILGLDDDPPVDKNGNALDIDALWTRIGRVKHASRRRHGGYTYLTATRWEDWQKTSRRDSNAQRMAEKRRAHAEHTPRTNGAHELHTGATEKEKEKEIDIPPTPQRGEQTPSAHASPPPTSATAKPPCASCGEPAFLQDGGANLCMACYELGAVVVPVKRLT